MLVLELVSRVRGDKSETGHPIVVRVGSEVSSAQELEETLVADGPSPEPGLLSNHVGGSHGVPALGELGCKFVDCCCHLG